MVTQPYSSRFTTSIPQKTSNAQNEPKSTDIHVDQSDTSKTPQQQAESNIIPFPHEKPPETKQEDFDNPSLGRGERSRKPGRYYKALNKGEEGERAKVAEANLAVSPDGDSWWSGSE